MKQALLLLFLGLIAQSWSVSLPLVLIVLIPFTVINKTYYVFILAFIFGILLDILSFKAIGYSSAFFCITLFMILMYERKFEIYSNYFVIFACFFASFLFGLFYGYPNIVLETLTSTILGVLIFALFKKFKSEGGING